MNDYYVNGSLGWIPILLLSLVLLVSFGLLVSDCASGNYGIVDHNHNQYEHNHCNCR